MPRKRRRAGGQSRQRVPGWVWLSLGLVLGLGLATGAWLSGLIEPRPPVPVRPDRNAQPPPDIQERVAPPAARVESAPDYHFYRALEADPAEPPVRDAPVEQARSEVRYWLQLGAFRRAADAEALKARLALMGVESSVSASRRNGQRWYRVRVGPFTSKRARQSVLGRLHAAGFEPLLLQEKADGG